MVVSGFSAGSSGSPWVRAFLQASSPCEAALLPFVSEAAFQHQGWVPPNLAQAKLLQDTTQVLKDRAAQAFTPIDATGVCPKRETYSDGGLYGAGCNYEFGFHGLQGRRLKCEDYVLHLPLGPNIFQPFDDCTRACLACVLDGHGGTGAVQYVAERFPTYLLEDLGRLRREPAAAMRAALHRVDEELTALGHNSGTTVNAMLLLDDHLTVINTGDCRCIVYDWLEERTVYVTHDHNLRSTQERERVRAAGAEVSTCGDYVVLPCPTEGAKLLGVTKALGHAGVKALQRSSTALSLSCGSGSGSILGAFCLSPPPSSCGGPDCSGVLSPGGAGGGVEGARPLPPCGGGGGGGAAAPPPRPPISLTGMSVASAAAAVEAGATGLLLPAMCSTSSGGCGSCGAGTLADCTSGSATSGMSEDERGGHQALPTPLASIDSEGECEAGCSCPEHQHGALTRQQQQHAARSAAEAGCSGGCAGAQPLPPRRSQELPPLGRNQSARSPRGCLAVTFARHSADPCSSSAHAGSPRPHAPPPFAAVDAAAPPPPQAASHGSSSSGAAGCGSGFLLTCEPDVFEWTVQDDRHLILLACDGVFDAMGNNEACTTVLRQLAESNSCLDAARKVTDRALKKESCDNITALVMRLGRKRIQRRKSMSVLNLRRCGSNTSADMALAGGGSAGAGGGAGSAAAAAAAGGGEAVASDSAAAKGSPVQ